MRPAWVVLAGAFGIAAWGQEASSGFDLRATVSAASFYTHELTEEPREGGPVAGGFRAMLYPTWKLSPHWTISGAVQIHSTPYFSEEFYNAGTTVKADILQASVGYSRYWGNRSLVVRAGQMTSTFGSFLPRYDDADNPLIDIPLAYGYYYKPVTNLGLTGVQADATWGRVDARAQFVNSSPANPRTIFDKDQYGSWAGGVGVTIQQGFRVGISAYRGPYLDRQYAYYFPGEAKPRDLPGSGYGLDAQWGRGPWNLYGELHRFQMAYRAIPTFNSHDGYVEARRVLNPRWYAATRIGFTRNSAVAGYEAYEMVAGFRPNTHQIIKIGYQIQHGPEIRGTLDNTVEFQLVTTFHAITLARD